jgi:hypothetical protein
MHFRLTNRWSVRVTDKAGSFNFGVRVAQLKD